MTWPGRVRRTLFGIPSAKRVMTGPGFDPQAWQKFAPVALSLAEGYHAALEDSRPAELEARLQSVDPQFAGFAYEGAGMALAALDVVAPWRDRLGALVRGPGAAHIYPIYVGAGLAYARLRRPVEARLHMLDPLLGWVVADGYGFHQVFFHRRRYVDRQHVPNGFTEFGRRMFDQGVGRALWFSGGADVGSVAKIIAGFPESRQGDLWGGVGLAAAYGGGVDDAGLRELITEAWPHTERLVRGAAIAAWGRETAHNQADHTDRACRIMCGRTGAEAALVLERARRDLPLITAQPRFECWRLQIDELLADAVPAQSAPE